MKTLPFVWEIGCEEIPATWLAKTLEQLRGRMEVELAAVAFESAVPEVTGTLRRLVVHVPRLPEVQADRVESVTGPPLKVARDDQGAWTKAALGFAKKNEVAPDELVVLSTPKGDYVGFDKRIEGRKAVELLPEVMLRVLRGLSFPKFMNWDATLPDGKPFPFGRPIRFMVALLGKQVVPFVIDVAGSPPVESGRRTRGHRFLAPKGRRAGASFAVTGYSDLKQKLKKHYVVLDPDERRRKLERALERLEKKAGAHRAQGLDAALVAELLEWPGAVLGSYPESFLELPAEVRHTVLIHHQHYFPLEGAPSFLAPTNMGSDPKGNMRRGAERVVVARLRDASFFWEDDLRRPLESRKPELEGVLFHRKLGSYLDKTHRVAPLARAIATRTGVDAGVAQRAAELAKCDLVTGMVGEFPELQGVMGGLYAREQGEPEPVWRAVYSHYQPLGLGDEDGFPSNPEGAVVSIADKLDTLVSMFGQGIVPTGSRDPFGLRRAALGMLRVLLESESRLSFSIPLSLRDLVGEATKEASTRASLEEFLLERLRYVLSRRYRYDELNAVLTEAALIRPVADTARRAAAVSAVRGSEDFEALSTAFKRVENILTGQSPGDVDAGRLVEPAERALYDAVEALSPEAAALVADGSYEEALRKLSTLRPKVDTFFDDVLVMAEDLELRANRIALLDRLRRLFSEVAALSEIVPAEDDG